MVSLWPVGKSAVTYVPNSVPAASNTSNRPRLNELGLTKSIATLDAGCEKSMRKHGASEVQIGPQAFQNTFVPVEAGEASTAQTVGLPISKLGSPTVKFYKDRHDLLISW